MSWYELPAGTAWTVAALPYGIFDAGSGPRVGVRIGDHVLDLPAVFDGEPWASSFAQPSLNALMAAGPGRWSQARASITDLFLDERHAERVRAHLYALDDVRLRLPIEVADYVDFYASEHHARNVGRIFRPDGEPLTPNWKHLPIGYHGRAGTVVVSGTDVVRPTGQRRGVDGPEFGPSQRLDIECELGFIVAGATEQGTCVEVDHAAEHLFGVVLLNDWSARDIQAWETVPLGPFLGKSFATSISAWVLPFAALDAARIALPPQEPQPLPYLQGADLFGLDIDCEVVLNGTTISRPPHRQMYWSPAQLLAHLTVNGASLRVGDLLGSGTISGPERAQRGSLIELTWNGEQPLELPDGSLRTFLEDGDVVTLRARAGDVPLGEVSGRIRPAR